MPTNYPTSLDSFTDPTSADTLDGTVGGAAVYHDVQHADANDAIEALEAKVGITGAETFLLKTGGTMSGAIAMGTNKLTGVGNGSASQDAAAFGQIPTALPPNGAAGGALTGTYPNPTLAVPIIPGQLLATLNYQSANAVFYTLTTTLTAIDTTNATLAFTVPASGKVNITVEVGNDVIGIAGSFPAIGYGLLNHSGGAQLGLTESPLGFNAYDASPGDEIQTRGVVTFVLTGLTPGALQVDFAACASQTTGGNQSQVVVHTGNGSTFHSGALIMMAYAGV